MLNTTSRYEGSHPMTWIELPWSLMMTPSLGKDVPLMIGMKTEDTIFEAMKEGEIEMLDNIWKRVKNNRSLTKLREEVGFQEAMVQVDKAAGEEPPEFKDHTPYSNKGMEDLLELNELASTVRTEIIPP